MDSILLICLIIAEDVRQFNEQISSIPSTTICKTNFEFAKKRKDQLLQWKQTASSWTFNQQIDAMIVEQTCVCEFWLHLYEARNSWYSRTARLESLGNARRLIDDEAWLRATGQYRNE